MDGHIKFLRDSIEHYNELSTKFQSCISESTKSKIELLKTERMQRLKKILTQELESLNDNTDCGATDNTLVTE